LERLEEMRRRVQMGRNVYAAGIRAFLAGIRPTAGDGHGRE
jgi:hypothetical protein